MSRLVVLGAPSARPSEAKFSGRYSGFTPLDNPKRHADAIPCRHPRLDVLGSLSRLGQLGHLPSMLDRLSRSFTMREQGKHLGVLHRHRF